MRAMRCHCAKQPLVYLTRQIFTFSRHAGNRTQIVKEKPSSVRRMRKIKRRRAPGVGFEPTRSAWSQISVKRPDHQTTVRVGILIGNQNWSKLSRSGDVQPEIKLPWPCWYFSRAPAIARFSILLSVPCILRNCCRVISGCNMRILLRKICGLGSVLRRILWLQKPKEAIPDCYCG